MSAMIEQTGFLLCLQVRVSIHANVLGNWLRECIKYYYVISFGHALAPKSSQGRLVLPAGKILAGTLAGSLFGLPDGFCSECLFCLHAPTPLCCLMHNLQANLITPCFCIENSMLPTLCTANPCPPKKGFIALGDTNFAHYPSVTFRNQASSAIAAEQYCTFNSR